MLCTACGLLKHDVCDISAWCRPVSSYCSDSSCAWTRSWFASLTPGYTMRWGFWTEVLLHRWKNHCCQNREFVNKPHTHLHVCACSLIDMHMHMKTHTHTHTCTLLCCCDHHVLRRDYMWNICLDLGRTAPSLPSIYSLLFMPLPVRLFVCVCMHGYICV